MSRQEPRQDDNEDDIPGTPTERITRLVAIAIAFVSVFIFFIKLIFL